MGHGMLLVLAIVSVNEHRTHLLQNKTLSDDVDPILKMVPLPSSLSSVSISLVALIYFASLS